jgi:hypothetical protein
VYKGIINVFVKAPDRFLSSLKSSSSFIANPGFSNDAAAKPI